MRNKISFVILSNSGSLIQQISLSKIFLKLFFIGCLACIGFFGYFLHDYIHLKETVSKSHQLETQLAERCDEIAEQRKQIQNFTEKINELKYSLVELKDFEKKVRVISNLENANEEEGLFGVGGDIPEDLQSELSPDESHDRLMRDMHHQLNRIDQASQIQKQNFKALINGIEEKVSLLASTPSIRPTSGWITSRFGYRKSPFTGRKEFHKGLDIATRKGTRIVAPADGIVTFAGRKGLMGNFITINHGHGILTRYGHLSKIVKKTGEKVKREEVIGYVGSSGRTTGPHLHYEVHLNGIPVNPAKYILN